MSTKVDKTQPTDAYKDEKKEPEDLDLILELCCRDKHKIPHIFETETWEIGKSYRARISHIYDPSKFWVVLKEKELDLFQKFLNSHYYKVYQEYAVPIDKIKVDFYCVVYTDALFFRAVIISIPAKVLKDTIKVQVFLLDYGSICSITTDDIFYLSEKFYYIPQFAIRASLVGVYPNKEVTWKRYIVDRISEHVLFKIVALYLVDVDFDRRVLYVKVGYSDEMGNILDVGETLMNSNMASPKFEPKLSKYSKYVPIVEYTYLNPSFEALESGSVPSLVVDSEILLTSVPPDTLYKNYYVYQE